MESQRAELKEATAARREVERELDGLRARDLYAAVTPDAAGVRWVVVRDGSTTERQRSLGQAIASLPGGVFVGTTSSPPGIVVAASEDSGTDAAAVLRAALSNAGGRGGGNARLAQGTVPAEALERAIAGVLGR